MGSLFNVLLGHLSYFDKFLGINPKSIVIILITIIIFITYLGWKNIYIYERFSFHVGHVRYSKQYSRLISYAFLHLDSNHLFFNMVGLYSFSILVLSEYGLVSFLFLYMLAILMGSLLPLFFYRNQPDYTMVGASGGMFGIIFTMLALFPHRELLLFYIIPMKGWILGLLLSVYSVKATLKPNPKNHVAHLTHLGGAMVGLILAGVFSPKIFFQNLPYIFIMSLPLIYLGYRILK